jgi:hypothetical protein
LVIGGRGGHLAFEADGDVRVERRSRAPDLRCGGLCFLLVVLPS